MTLTLSIIAIVISITSLGFSIYQYYQGSKIKINDKVSSLLEETYTFRKFLDDKKKLCSNTDDIPDYKDLFESGIITVENTIVPVLEKSKISVDDFYLIERKFMGLRNEIELTCKQIEEAIRFNEEGISVDMKPMKFENYD